MTEQYGGEEPPATFSAGIAAPACVRTKHDAIIVLGCPNDADGKPSACQTARADLAQPAFSAPAPHVSRYGNGGSGGGDVSSDLVLLAFMGAIVVAGALLGRCGRTSGK